MIKNLDKRFQFLTRDIQKIQPNLSQYLSSISLTASLTEHMPGATIADQETFSFRLVQDNKTIAQIQLSKINCRSVSLQYPIEAVSHFHATNEKTAALALGLYCSYMTNAQNKSALVLSEGGRIKQQIINFLITNFGFSPTYMNSENKPTLFCSNIKDIIGIRFIDKPLTKFIIPKISEILVNGSEQTFQRSEDELREIDKFLEREEKRFRKNEEDKPKMEAFAQAQAQAFKQQQEEQQAQAQIFQNAFDDGLDDDGNLVNFEISTEDMQRLNQPVSRPAPSGKAFDDNLMSLNMDVFDEDNRDYLQRREEEYNQKDDDDDDIEGFADVDTNDKETMFFNPSQQEEIDQAYQAPQTQAKADQAVVQEILDKQNAEKRALTSEYNDVYQELLDQVASTLGKPRNEIDFEEVVEFIPSILKGGAKGRKTKGKSAVKKTKKRTKHASKTKRKSHTKKQKRKSDVHNVSVLNKVLRQLKAIKEQVNAPRKPNLPSPETPPPPPPDTPPLTTADLVIEEQEKLADAENRMASAMEVGEQIQNRKMARIHEFYEKAAAMLERHRQELLALNGGKNIRIQKRLTRRRRNYKRPKGWNTKRRRR
jgi:hypothetical protein